MYIITFFLLFLLYSCSYTDIDTVPGFHSLKMSKEEEIDKCEIRNTFKSSSKVIKKNKIYLKYSMIERFMLAQNQVDNSDIFENEKVEDCYKELKNIIGRL